VKLCDNQNYYDSSITLFIYFLTIEKSNRKKKKKLKFSTVFIVKKFLKKQENNSNTEFRIFETSDDDHTDIKINKMKEKNTTDNNPNKIEAQNNQENSVSDNEKDKFSFQDIFIGVNNIKCKMIGKGSKKINLLFYLKNQKTHGDSLPVQTLNLKK